MPEFDVLKALALVRRYAEAIADGQLEARAVASMTDEELATFDTEAYAALQAKQAEAEALVQEPE